MGSPTGRLCNDYYGDISAYLIHNHIRWMQVNKPNITVSQVIRKLDRDLNGWRGIFINGDDPYDTIRRILDVHEQGNSASIDSLKRSLHWARWYTNEGKGRAA